MTSVSRRTDNSPPHDSALLKLYEYGMHIAEACLHMYPDTFCLSLHSWHQCHAQLSRVGRRLAPPADNSSLASAFPPVSHGFQADQDCWWSSKSLVSSYMILAEGH